MQKCTSFFKEKQQFKNLDIWSDSFLINRSKTCVFPFLCSVHFCRYFFLRLTSDNFKWSLAKRFMNLWRSTVKGRKQTECISFLKWTKTRLKRRPLHVSGCITLLQELSLCHKFSFCKTYIFAALWCKPLIFQTYIMWSISFHSLKY